MLETSVEYLLHAEHFAAKNVLDIVDMAVRVRESHINGSLQIGQASVIDENPDDRRHGGESGCGKR
jgi:hypothetical protein